MPAGSVSACRSDVVARLRAWWEESTFLGDVAVLFTIVTVGNSLMMLTGLDEPKNDTFAYVHLLGRLGIITGIVGLFHLDEVRKRLARQRRPSGHASRLGRQRRSPRTVLVAVVESFLGDWLDGTARVFTVIVAGTCVVVLALAGIRAPAGGSGLYRNLVLLAVILLPVMHVATRWWHHRRSARTTRPD
jgi:hypothetical protein